MNVKGLLKYIPFITIFLKLNQSYLLTAEEVNHNQLEEKIAKMDSYFKMKQTNMAVQEAGTLIFLLKMVAKEDQERAYLLQVSSVHWTSDFKHKRVTEVIK